MQIRNSIFLVTGGASGLGAATARMAVENGGKVVIADLQVEAGEKLAKELGGRFAKTDVSNEADGKAAVALAVKEFGGLHVLVNCAGIALAERTIGKDAPHDLGRFVKVITVNVVGTFNMIRLAADAMAKAGPNASGERGVIVNTASVAARRDGGRVLGRAGRGVTRGLRGISRNGIRVCTIAPGIFRDAIRRCRRKRRNRSAAGAVPSRLPAGGVGAAGEVDRRERA
jgi:NAD(P)-dependent dehydrogenase (short-subunit alcohol dehydrogenase family)